MDLKFSFVFKHFYFITVGNYASDDLLTTAFLFPSLLPLFPAAFNHITRFHFGHMKTA